MRTDEFKVLTTVVTELNESYIVLEETVYGSFCS